MDDDEIKKVCSEFGVKHADPNDPIYSGPATVTFGKRRKRSGVGYLLGGAGSDPFLNAVDRYEERFGHRVPAIVFRSAKLERREQLTSQVNEMVERGEPHPRWAREHFLETELREYGRRPENPEHDLRMQERMDQFLTDVGAVRPRTRADDPDVQKD